MTARIRIVVEEEREQDPGPHDGKPIYGFEERQDYIVDVPDELDAYELARSAFGKTNEEVRLVRSLLILGRSQR